MKSDSQIQSKGGAQEAERSSLHEVLAALEQVVTNLTDHQRWRWIDMCSGEQAATAMLKLLAEKHLIEHREHPMGGDVWRINRTLYGRTDSITNENFETLKRSIC